MSKHLVSIVAYEKPQESVRKAVEMVNGLDHLPAGAKVFIKPNIVFWSSKVEFPKYGVITTSRVIEDVVILLKEKGITDITIGEGVVTRDVKDVATPAHAFQTLGYGRLNEKYGVKYINTLQGECEKVDLGDGAVLAFSKEIVRSDFVVNIPVMKSHNQTRVSLGIKNLKGTIDIPSRKRCHSADEEKDLNWWVARLADKMPPMLTIYDGIYTNERGPGFDGRMHRSNILMAAVDVLAGDLVACKVLGHEPAEVPHLVHAARNHNRALDLSDVEVKGKRIESVARFHAWNYDYSDETGGFLPVPMAKQGISGINYPKYDTSMCTYCSSINGVVLQAIRYAWQGTPFDDVEVLTGKKMKPTPGRKHTILLGKCMYQAHKENPDIAHMIAVKGCPPKPDELLNALKEAGIDANPDIFKNIDYLPAFFLERYKGKPEFDENFYRIS
jgi:uncharacterized protein (DUF362 family)